MQYCLLTKIEEIDYKRIYEKISKDFHDNEVMPFSNFNRQLRKSIFEGFLLMYNNIDIGYCINLISKDRKNILILYIGIDENLRNRGFGSIFLNLIKETYIESDRIIVEVEKIEFAKDESDRVKRVARINYYLKNEFKMLDRIDYSIFNTNMHLMVYELSNKNTSDKEIVEIVKSLYYTTLPSNLKNMVVIKLNK